MVYSTYLGGTQYGHANGIAVDITDDAFVAGQTCSLDFPLSAPLQETPGGNCDAFVSKIIPSGGVSVIPAGLIFPNTDLLTTSPAQIVTLTNGGNAALSITSIAVTGANSSDFAQTNTCATSVPALGTCTISVTFTPTSVKPPTRTAEVTITDSGTGSPQVVDLTGTAGTAPLVSLSSNSLAFSTTQTVGVTSAPLILNGDEHWNRGSDHYERRGEWQFCGSGQRQQLHDAAPGHNATLELHDRCNLHPQCRRAERRVINLDRQRAQQPPSYSAYGNRGGRAGCVAFGQHSNFCFPACEHHQCCPDRDGNQYRLRSAEHYVDYRCRPLWPNQHLCFARGTHWHLHDQRDLHSHDGGQFSRHDHLGGQCEQ